MSSSTTNNESKYEVSYIVTYYGCNSTPSEMWPPESKIFTHFDEAYECFLQWSPSLHDEDNVAEKTIHSDIKDNNIVVGYTLIESRVQLPGYYDGDGTRAKRPEGCVIARFVKEIKSA